MCEYLHLIFPGVCVVDLVLIVISGHFTHRLIHLSRFLINVGRVDRTPIVLLGLYTDHIDLISGGHGAFIFYIIRAY